MPIHSPIIKRIQKHATKENKKSKKSFKKSIKTTIKRKRQQRLIRKKEAQSRKLIAPKQKIFNNRQFKRHKTAKTKAEAVIHKNKFLNSGVRNKFWYSVRVVKVKNGYGVYRRYRKEREG